LQQLGVAPRLCLRTLELSYPSGRPPFVSGPHTGIDKQQVSACSFPVGISAGLKLASTVKETGRKCVLLDQ